MGLCFTSWLRNNLEIDAGPGLNGASLEKVEVSKKESRWLLHLNLQQPVEKPTLESLAGQIHNQYRYLDGVGFKVRVSDNRSVEKLLTEKRAELALYCQEQARATLPEEVLLQPDGYRLNLLVEQEDTYESLLGSDICLAIGDWFRNQYCLETVVRVLKNNPGPKTGDQQPCIIDQNVHDPAVAYNPALNGSPRSRQRKALFRSIKGEALPIKELTEGMRGAVVDAGCWNARSNRLKAAAIW